MKYTYQSVYEKRQVRELAANDTLILSSRFKPNTPAVFKNGLVNLKYASVQAGEMCWFAETRYTGRFAFIPESSLSQF